MKLKDPYTEPEGFEPIVNMETEEIRSMVNGYVKVSDRQKLTEILAVCRDLFFDDEVI